MQYSVSKSAQTSGGGDYIVKYEAEVELLDDGTGVTVEVLSTIPPDCDAGMLKKVVEHIRRGAESVLVGRSAKLRLSRLVVHPVDFKGYRFEAITADALRGAMWENLDSK